MELQLNDLKSMIFYNPDTGMFSRKHENGIRPISIKGIKPNIKIKGKSYNIAKLAWYYMTGENFVFNTRHSFGYKDENKFNVSFDNLVPLWERGDTLSQARLVELFDYDSESGNLLRRYTMGGKKPGIVDAEHQSGYIRVSIFGERYMVHSIVWIWNNDSYDMDTMLIDHIDHNGFNNRIKNLRLTDPCGNARNRSRNSERTLPTGVDYRPEKYPNFPFVARVKTHGKTMEIGRYKTADEANVAVTAVRNSLGFHQNHGE